MKRALVSTVFLVAYLCIFVNNNGDNQLPTQKRCQSNMPIWFVWFYCVCSVMDKVIMISHKTMSESFVVIQNTYLDPNWLEGLKSWGLNRVNVSDKY